MKTKCQMELSISKGEEGHFVDFSALIMVVQMVCQMEIQFGQGEGLTFELMSINRVRARF